MGQYLCCYKKQTLKSTLERFNVELSTLHGALSTNPTILSSELSIFPCFTYVQFSDADPKEQNCTDVEKRGPRHR